MHLRLLTRNIYKSTLNVAKISPFSLNFVKKSNFSTTKEDQVITDSSNLLIKKFQICQPVNYIIIHLYS